MRFETRLHISAYSPTLLVTWRIHDHAHCMGKLAEVCNHVQLHHQIDQALPLMLKSMGRPGYETTVTLHANFHQKIMYLLSRYSGDNKK